MKQDHRDRESKNGMSLNMDLTFILDPRFHVHHLLPDSGIGDIARKHFASLSYDCSIKTKPRTSSKNQKSRGHLRPIPGGKK